VWELCETVCGLAKTCGRVLGVHRSGSFHTLGAAHDASRVASARMVVPTRTRISETNGGMQIKTILNRKSSVFGAVFDWHVRPSRFEAAGFVRKVSRTFQAGAVLSAIVQRVGVRHRAIELFEAS
jgi:hypothetical protein